MFAVDHTRIAICSTLLLCFVLVCCLNSYLNNYCVLVLTGESFTVSNCKVDQALISLVREQRELLLCRI